MGFLVNRGFNFKVECHVYLPKMSGRISSRGMPNFLTSIFTFEIDGFFCSLTQDENVEVGTPNASQAFF